MRRRVLGLDRLIAILLGFALLGGGAALITWYTGDLRRIWPEAPTELSTDLIQDATDQPWWPWAAGGAGSLLLLLGLWWLIAHLPRRSVGMLTLPGSSGSGRLLLDPAGPATAAAEVLADTVGVRSTQGKVIRDRGQLVVELTATVDPAADLATVISAADDVTADLDCVLGREDAHARVRLSVARTHRTQRRVE
ncbi:hypothetical protein [Actinoplanes sp. NPDC051859]|uniref:hypothetical protein n=1 Tax=Actinoplanes sp. NPDC051859 TaxID=3363909 RepID=UPI0037914A81